jgi:chemosensory pili system protein ChpA (sensor histidine kinase/response regulator)
LPPEVLAQPPCLEPLARIKTERGKYQAALLRWLRQDNPEASLQAMRSAVQAVMACAPQDGRRAFWWAAGALLDCMDDGGLADVQEARKLLGRIDLQMKAFAEGQPAGDEGILRELLHQLACSRPVSDTVAAVQRTYALTAPQLEPLSGREAAAMLEAMRAQLEAAKENWELCARDGAVMPEFLAQLAQLASMAGRLEPAFLQPFCQQMQSAAARTSNSEQSRRLAPEMAMSLLLLGSGLERHHELSDTFAEQARILSGRMVAALADAAQDESRFAGLVALLCRVEARNASVQLLGEAVADLEQAVLGLRSLFGGGDREPVALNAQSQPRAERLAHLLQRVQNGLSFLGHEQPTPLLQSLQQTLNYFAEGGRPSRDKIQAVAAALGAVQDYARALLQQTDSDAARPGVTGLDSALRGMQAMQLPTIAPEAGKPAADAAQAAAGAPREGDELLEVFLEEAGEVLGSMRANLEALQREPASREPLMSIRRGFHTLKGSGRMVGLGDLAEAAWAIERTLNKWLQENKPATPALLKLVLDAETAFQGWVETLGAEGEARVEADDLVTSARHVESHLDAAQLAKAPPSASLAVSVAAQASPASHGKEPPPVVIGAVTLSPALFGIATEEAAQHGATLRSHLDGLRSDRQVAVSHDFTRAAHTLAGVYRTLGFDQAAGLAYALEQWLEQRIGRPLGPDGTQLDLLAQAIAALQDMGTALRRRCEPQPRPDLLDRLQEATAVPQAGSAPPAPPAPAPAPPAAAIIPPQARPAVEQRATRDDMDEQLLPIFLEEADDLCPQAGNALRAWRAQPDDKALGRSLQRSLHTLKGSARMAGAMRLGELTHRMEDKVVQAMEQARHDAAFWDDLESCLDRIGGIVEQLRAQHAAGAAPAPGVQVAPTTRPEAGAERGVLDAQLRVRAGTVDCLVNEAGEISVARSRIEAETREFRNGLRELADSASHLRKQLREIEIQAEGQIQARTALVRGSAGKFDPLEFDRYTRFQELTRFMNESVHDVQTVQQGLLKNLEEMAAALAGQARLARELQQNLLAIRMVPFAGIAERLYRVVRQTCKELGKKANLELRGTEVELDRNVLERMTAPFEHLLRNSIAHGMEPAARREAAGKPPIGDIRLALRQESNEIVFEFSDDGAGLDFDGLRRKARDIGLLREGAEADDEQIVQMIFASGLSTAAEVTEVSGRGVGMDVVRSEIAALGGRIAAFSERGNGVRFLIHLPLTLAASHVLMVRAGQEMYAIPSAMAELVRQAKPAELEEIYRRSQIEWQGRSYPVRYLPHLLGREECMPESRQYNRILLLQSGGQRLALHVDELLGKQEAVIKNIGPQLAHLPGIAGATVLGDGSVVLIINPVLLAQRAGGVRKAAPAAAVEPAPAAPLVMVVDDSLTVRKITSRLLARAGYQVAAARDGVDALEQMAEALPAVLLLDIEMPRMDGFELTQRLRQDPRTKGLPIIIITSRTADKHRDYARELGVNAYLGKPYQEAELLQQVASFVAVGSRSAPPA